MGTRNISITDDAYIRLKNLKVGDESFSEIINRLTQKRLLSTFASILSEESADEFGKRLESYRKSYDGDFSKRIKRMTRLLE